MALCRRSQGKQCLVGRIIRAYFIISTISTVVCGMELRLFDSIDKIDVDDASHNDEPNQLAKTSRRKLKTGQHQHDYPSVEKHEYPPGPKFIDRCASLKRGDPMVIVGTTERHSEYQEGNVTRFGEKYIWSGKESGICTVVSEANSTGYVSQLCTTYYTFDNQTWSHDDSTLVVTGVYVTNWPKGTFGHGKYTITGGTGCFAGVSGVVNEVYSASISPTTGNKIGWVDVIELEQA